MIAGIVRLGGKVGGFLKNSSFLKTLERFVTLLSAYQFFRWFGVKVASDVKEAALSNMYVVGALIVFGMIALLKVFSNAPATVKQGSGVSSFVFFGCIAMIALLFLGLRSVNYELKEDKVAVLEDMVVKKNISAKDVYYQLSDGGKIPKVEVVKTLIIRHKNLSAEDLISGLSLAEINEHRLLKVAIVSKNTYIVGLLLSNKYINLGKPILTRWQTIKMMLGIDVYSSEYPLDVAMESGNFEITKLVYNEMASRRMIEEGDARRYNEYKTRLGVVDK
jgi:hypothetical protein